MEVPFTALGANLTTVGAVQRRLDRQLDLRGYVRRSYYAVPGGFAVATQAERFDREGRSVAGDRRWKLSPTGLFELPQPFRFGALLSAFRNADPGRYRVIVFLVTTKNRTSGIAPISAEEATIWLDHGGDRVPPQVAAIPLDATHHMTALIYEFSRSSVRSKLGFDDPSELDARRHLTAAGIIGAGL